jgi:hypothetical protein
MTAVFCASLTQVYIGILEIYIDAMIIAQNIIYQPLMAIVGLLRHIGIQLMTLMTPIIPFFKSLDKSLSIKQRSSLFFKS